MELPFLTADLPPLEGALRARPEFFRVEEVPAYLPSGEGEHLFVEFEKSGLGTREAVDRIAKALGLSPRDAAHAGLKDKHAVTTQWASFWRGDRERALALELEGVRILSAARHGNKLRTGHLRGNRFVIRVTDTTSPASAFEAVLARLASAGCPNYYGEQRFGIGGGNLSDARAWITGARPAPRDKSARRFLVSVLQSSIFNQVLAARVTEGLLHRYVRGDLLKKEDTGGLFTTEDTADAEARVAAWAVSATGPMVGPEMRWPEHDALARERSALEAAGLTEDSLRAFGRDGEGTRRVLRIRPTETRVSQVDATSVEIAFTLPSGAYATVVLREMLKRDHAAAPHRNAAP